MMSHPCIERMAFAAYNDPDAAWIVGHTVKCRKCRSIYRAMLRQSHETSISCCLTSGIVELMRCVQDTSLDRISYESMNEVFWHSKKCTRCAQHIRSARLENVARLRNRTYQHELMLLLLIGPSVDYYVPGVSYHDKQLLIIIEEIQMRQTNYFLN
jgi:hypothetical protein